MEQNEQKQYLLYEEDTEAASNKGYIPLSPQQQLRSIKANPLTLILLVFSFGINIVFFSYYFFKDIGFSSRYVGLHQDVQPFQRWRFTSYSHPNETIRDAAWDSIDIDRTIIALDHSEAVALGLPPTAVFPWDDQKDIYAISAYHQFHCLKLLYRSLQEAHHGKEFTNDYTHILHCLDSLRGDFKCMADDQLLSVGAGYNPPIAAGQFMQCRDFSQLDQWARDHHSCFKYNYINDEKPPTEMHQWRNCPEGSEYTPKMREYFGYNEDWVPEFVGNHGPEFLDEYEEKVDS